MPARRHLFRKSCRIGTDPDKFGRIVEAEHEERRLFRRPGIARARPPVPYKRKDRLLRQARAWGTYKLENALQLLTDTDLQLRSASTAPQMALMERALIRLAMMNRR